MRHPDLDQLTVNFYNMLAFATVRGAVSLCRPINLYTGNTVCVGRVAVRGNSWKRLVSGEAKAVRAIPVESGGIRARLSGKYY